VVLRNISWETYERLLLDLEDCSVPHLTYDDGDLEIMSSSSLHERITRAVDQFIYLVTEELEINASCLGSTTFRLEVEKRGFEPDSCFYFGENEPLIRGKDNIDPRVDPVPDLVIETDVTSPSIARFPIFASLGVPEIWRYKDGRFQIFNLEDGFYIKKDDSSLIPMVTAEVLTQFIAEFITMNPLEWMKKVRDWARSIKDAK
jgi:Uma2 family endonuclease